MVKSQDADDLQHRCLGDARDLLLQNFHILLAQQGGFQQFAWRHALDALKRAELLEPPMDREASESQAEASETLAVRFPVLQRDDVDVTASRCHAIAA